MCFEEEDVLLVGGVVGLKATKCGKSMSDFVCYDSSRDGRFACSIAMEPSSS